MALKTFNVDPEVYRRFSSFCKRNGLNMSKQVELFMASFVEGEAAAKKDIGSRIRSNKKVGYAGFVDPMASYED